MLNKTKVFTFLYFYLTFSCNFEYALYSEDYFSTFSKIKNVEKCRKSKIVTAFLNNASFSNILIIFQEEIYL